MKRRKYEITEVFKYNYEFDYWLGGRYYSTEFFCIYVNSHLTVDR